MTCKVNPIVAASAAFPVLIIALVASIFTSVPASAAPLSIVFFETTETNLQADFDDLVAEFRAEGNSAANLSAAVTETTLAQLEATNGIGAFIVVDEFDTGQPLVLNEQISFEISSIGSSAFSPALTGDFGGTSYDSSLVYAEDADGNRLTGNGDAQIFEILATTVFFNLSDVSSFQDDGQFDIEVFLDVNDAAGNGFFDDERFLSVNSVPEPTSLMLLAAGGLLLLRRQ